MAFLKGFVSSLPSNPLSSYYIQSAKSTPLANKQNQRDIHIYLETITIKPKPKSPQTNILPTKMPTVHRPNFLNRHDYPNPPPPPRQPAPSTPPPPRADRPHKRHRNAHHHCQRHKQYQPTNSVCRGRRRHRRRHGAEGILPARTAWDHRFGEGEVE
ncbi:hypothetical protein ACJ73_09810 [Blastomyces percursus]|uniref:Uncharacterized protein n=1 Tax=Blastomyces percursus TaxID=1658174 RepID=A0A1J9Q2A1_9EURO|nr:hypothetical protein ACJ73_09810 [Blastomyces percursus]